MNPTVFLAYPDMAVPVRRIPVHRYELGTNEVIDLEVVCTEDVSECRLSCSEANWCEVSDDGGGSYNSVTTNAQTSYDIGALVAGNRQAIKLRVNIASGVRGSYAYLNLGVGT